MPYELLDHTADLGIRATGPTLKDLFETAARAMMEQIADPQQVSGSLRKTVAVTGLDREDLLINWLREILGWWAMDSVLIRDARILELTDFTLRAEISGENFDPARHEILNDIKAVTYHKIAVAQTSTGWTADIIFDV